MKHILAGSLWLFMLLAIGCESDPVAVRETPTEVDALGALPSGLTARRALGPAALSTEIVNERGNIIWSADGLGIPGASGTITIGKPSPLATVRKAVFAAATVPGGGSIPNNQITIDGSGVAWNQVITGAIGNRNHWSDVTSKLAAKLNAAPVGPLDFTINEGSMTSAIDGTILVVVWDDPAVVPIFSVIVLFGAQSTSGDTFRVFFDNPFTSFGLVEMALGISFGCNTSNVCGSGPGGQFSTVDVEGQRLTSSAGGQDDGALSNGALLTMGGFGDSPSNPAPFASASTAGDPDDEYYTLTSFIKNNATFFDVFTRNPSNDDNIFLALIYTNPPGGIESSPGPPPPPPGDDDGGGEDLSCDEVPQLINDVVTQVVNTNFANFPAFVRNQFIATVIRFSQPFINQLTSGNLTVSQMQTIIGQIKTILATFGIPLSDQLVNQLLQIVQDCRQQNA